MPVPTNGELERPSRLQALERLEILDTPPEASFDEIVDIARTVCDTPVALVSLVTSDRQWFKAHAGTDIPQTPIGQSVCAHTVAERAMVIVPDLNLDPRTADNTLVTEEPHMRFYAGAPLISREGEVLGSLCVIDLVPRPAGLTAKQQQVLTGLAREVVNILELRRIAQTASDLGSSAVARAARREAELALNDAVREARSSEDVILAGSRTIGSTLGVQRVGYAAINLTAGTFTVERDWTAPDIASVVGEASTDLLPGTFAELRTGRPLVIDDVETDWRLVDDRDGYRGMGTAAQIKVPVLRAGRLVGVLFVQSATPRSWTAAEVDFVAAIAERVYSGIARIEAERQQTLVNEELSHRLKNTLSMAKAIATQTLRGKSEPEALEAFNSRLIALSHAHELLLQRNWSAAHMHSVLDSVIPLELGRDRFTIGGPDIQLGAKSVLTLSLLVHELITNAIKYGALSATEGRVHFTWAIDPAGEDGHELVVNWVEEGGPPASAPERRGFGSRLIAAGLAAGGRADTTYTPAGFRGTFTGLLSTLTNY